MFLSLALVLSLLSQAPVGSPTFSVFVSAPVRDGFLDVSKDTFDTIKDISDQLKDDRQLRLVDRKEDADVVIIVIGRGMGSSAYGARTEVYKNYYGGASVETLPVVANTRWITTVLIAGSYKREFGAARTNTSEYSLGDWTEDAKEIIRNIHAWVLANTDNLRARRVR